MLGTRLLLGGWLGGVGLLAQASAALWECHSEENHLWGSQLHGCNLFCCSETCATWLRLLVNYCGGGV
jgi:hypothetical protein